MSTVDSAISSVVAAKQDALKSEVQFAVASKQLKAQRREGAAAARLVEQAAQIGRASGKGGLVDASA